MAKSIVELFRKSFVRIPNEIEGLGSYDDVDFLNVGSRFFKTYFRNELRKDKINKIFNEK